MFSYLFRRPGKPPLAVVPEKFHPAWVFWKMEISLLNGYLIHVQISRVALMLLFIYGVIALFRDTCGWRLPPLIDELIDAIRFRYGEYWTDIAALFPKEGDYLHSALMFVYCTSLEWGQAAWCYFVKQWNASFPGWSWLVHRWKNTSWTH